MLYAWAFERDLQIKRAWDLADGEICRITPLYPRSRTPGTAGYDKIWVRVSSDLYRTGLQHQALSAFKLTPKELTGVHADHIINRARLKNHPDGWVCLFPVPARANTHFGSVVERKLAPVDGSVDRIDLSPLVAFKLFCGIFPRSPVQLDTAMKSIRGQWHTQFPHIQDFIDEMHVEATPYMKWRIATVRKKPRSYVAPPVRDAAALSF
ncbi:hypothetical protein HFO91_00165 [Rhizobium leguminosarum]|nr:hypothetical protein [Rhizobium leguminosarum]MBY5448097.1 hypothetical protein [Rhizobium leguminosarum]